MFEHRKHHHVIKLCIIQRQPAPQISVDPLPAAVCSALHLIINPNTARDFIFRKIEKRHFQTASQITNARASAQVRICRTEPHLGYEMIDLRVGHLFAGCFAVSRCEIVVPNVRPAADTQHAKEE